MDRFSIIQQQVFNRKVVDETSSCDLDQCICDDTAKSKKQSWISVDLFQVALVTIVAFIGALTMKANMTSEDMMSAKKVAVISCSSKSDSSDDKLPGDRDNSNTCSHQQGFLYESNNSKRKFLRTHHC